MRSKISKGFKKLFGFYWAPIDTILAVIFTVALLFICHVAMSAEQPKWSYPSKEQIHTQRVQLERVRREILWAYGESAMTKDDTQRCISLMFTVDVNIIELKFKEKNYDNIVAFERRKFNAEMKHFGHRRNPGSEDDKLKAESAMLNIADHRPALQGTYKAVFSVLNGFTVDSDMRSKYTSSDLKYVPGIAQALTMYPDYAQARIAKGVKSIVITEELSDGAYGNFAPFDPDYGDGISRIRVNSKYPLTRLDGQMTLVHEFAHAIDFSYRIDTGYWLSDGARWQNIFKTSGRMVDSYASKNPREAFAESIAVYLYYPEAERHINPQVYEYVDSLFRMMKRDRDNDVAFAKDIDYRSVHRAHRRGHN